MRIRQLWLENFGCIENATLTFDGFTTLIGPNNSGKSTILSAIDKFFTPAPHIDTKHFFRHDESKEISISIEFGDLTPAERNEFGPAVVNDKLRVTRHFGGELGLSGVYSVDANAHPGFKEFREETNGTTKRTLYAQLRPKYGLPAANGAAMEEALASWEANNPNELEMVRTRGFFGAPNVAAGKLRKKTAVRFIPAVADIGSETDGPKSPVIELIADIRRQTLENKAEYVSLIDQANDAISAFVEGVEDKNVTGIGDAITELLKRYYSDTEISAELPPPEDIEVFLPNPLLLVRHRAVQGGVDVVGHGLQRAILFSVVQFLAQHYATLPSEPAEPAPMVEANQPFEEPASDILILIEEPEIYQHPQKQRIIRGVLERIADSFDPASGIRVQIAVCTHSEKFVRIAQLDALRIVRTTYDDDQYETSISALTVEQLRNQIHAARGGQGDPMPIGTFAASMHIFSDAVSEGFFADKVILVEGVDDEAVIEATYRSRGRDPMSEGIAIVQVDGKTKLDKPLQAFRSLGIKTYCVFDNDQAKGPQRIPYNQLLQAICGVGAPADFPEGNFPAFTALAGNLEAYLKKQTGDAYDHLRAKVAEDFSVNPSDLIKSPAMASAFLTLARAAKHEFPLFDDILKAVDNL